MSKRSDAALETRISLLNAAMNVMRQKGYQATTVDDICDAAAVTKGSFFHHFSSKESLAIDAAKHFADMANQLFLSAPYQSLPDPRQRLLGYVDFRIEILQGPICGFTCLLGTLVQELYDTHPAIRQACDCHMADHIAMLMRDIEQTKTQYAPHEDFTPESLGYFMQSALQGALIFTKARQTPRIAVDALIHLRKYLEQLFPIPKGD